MYPSNCLVPVIGFPLIVLGTGIRISQLTLGENLIAHFAEFEESLYWGRRRHEDRERGQDGGDSDRGRAWQSCGSWVCYIVYCGGYGAWGTPEGLRIKDEG
jgi:hypothetical protein